MEVISNKLLNSKFRRLKEYKLDLGMALKVESKSNGKDRSSKWIMKDNIVKKYYNIVGQYISKTGRIGTLLFYIDSNLDNNDVLIMEKDEIYKSTFNTTDNIRTQLTKLLSDILSDNLSPYKVSTLEEEIEPDLKNMSTEELMKYLRENR